MDWLPANEVLQRRANVALIAAFLVLLWLPVADAFLHLDRKPPPNENRVLAKWPEFTPSLQGVQDCMAGFEKWHNDHFGFRSRLLRWEQSWKWRVLREARDRLAMIGSEGWMFLAGSKVIADHRGEVPYSAAELEGWRKLLTTRRDWLAERGIRFLFVVAPTKHLIYPEYLPKWIGHRGTKPARLDQFVAHMKANSDVPLLDLRPALFEAKKAEKVYLKTDTHWNNRGAYAGYRSIVGELEKLGIAVKPHDRADFESRVADVPAGDLARLLGREQDAGDKGEVIFSPGPAIPAVTSRNDPSVSPKHWTPSFTELVVTETPSQTGRAVLFRDSFSNALIQFLSPHFGRVVYVWQMNWDKTIIEREKPDVVIDEMVDFFMLTSDPAKILRADDRPEVQMTGSL